MSVLRRRSIHDLRHTNVRRFLFELTKLALLIFFHDVTSFVSAAQAAPAGFTDELVVGGLNNPTAMAFAPDGRLFVTQQTGSVRVVKAGALLSEPFLSLTVDPQGERGLLGIAFHPNFAINGFVYVYHTVPGTPPHNRVTRFTADGDVASPSSAAAILDLNNLSDRTNHNGGGIHFGKDGKLYVAVGENATSANSQSLANRLGKILQLNDDGSIPSDNPSSFPGITGNPVGDNRAIWAVGLRNPFTFAFQPHTGVMMLNDVGERTFEEVNLGLAGRNYGWPATEGTTSIAGFTSPIYAYAHAAAPPSGCAISGGTFYNPDQPTFPSTYVGKYFFSDYCGNWIYQLDPSIVDQATLFQTGLSGPVDIDVGTDGALYYLQRGNGQIRRIRYTGESMQGLVVEPRQLEITEGDSALVAVRLASQPTSDIQVMVNRYLGPPAIDVTPKSLTFTSANWASDQQLTVSAGDDVDKIDQTTRYRLTASGLAPVDIWATSIDTDRKAGSPRAVIKLPRTGDVVSGANAEFFGDGIGSGTIVRAQYFIDDVLRYTDVNNSGHYHLGGDHNLWNTLTLSNGYHLIMMRVFDNMGRSASHNIKIIVRN